MASAEPDPPPIRLRLLDQSQENDVSSTPRDPSTLTDADLPTMTEEEEALYYEANAHRLDEIFDARAKVEFEVRACDDDHRSSESGGSQEADLGP